MTLEEAKEAFFGFSCLPHHHDPYPHVFKLNFIPDAVFEVLRGNFSSHQ